MVQGSGFRVIQGSECRVQGLGLKFRVWSYGLWFLVYGLWLMVYGLWLMVDGLWFMVYGL